MCAIVGSFSKDKLSELFTLNAYRGQLSYSLCSFNSLSQIDILENAPGAMPENFIKDFASNYFYIGHSQAPTTESKNIHPARYNGALLWHNGIVKQKSLAPGTWDTEWVLQGIQLSGWDFLSTVDGTFACIYYYDQELYVFRNEISPLFIDGQLNISSTKFAGSTPLDPNVVYKLNLAYTRLEPIAAFKTKENPYYFGE